MTALPDLQDAKTIDRCSCRGLINLLAYRLYLAASNKRSRGNTRGNKRPRGTGSACTREGRACLTPTLHNPPSDSCLLRQGVGLAPCTVCSIRPIVHAVLAFHFHSLARLASGRQTCKCQGRCEPLHRLASLPPGVSSAGRHYWTRTSSAINLVSNHNKRINRRSL